MKLAIYIILAVILVTGSIIWSVFQWKQCRSYGFSKFYCYQHIG